MNLPIESVNGTVHEALGQTFSITGLKGFRAFTSLVFLLTICAIPDTPASAETVSQCGQALASTAKLEADLNCSAYTDGPAVSIGEGALSLNGFRLIGNPGQPVVTCEGPCEIRGPGRIEGGLHSVQGTDCEVRNATLDGAMDDSVSCSSGDIRNSTISGAGKNGFYGTQLRIKRSVISACAQNGIDTATSLLATRVEVRDCGATGLYCFGPPPGQQIRFRAVTAENNGGAGISVFTSSDPIRISKSILRGNLHGVWGNTTFNVSDSEISGSQLAGIYAGGSVLVSDSTIAGNCQNWDPNDWQCCKDLWAEGDLEVRKVTCDTSGGVGGGSCTSYGVCTLD